MYVCIVKMYVDVFACCFIFQVAVVVVSPFVQRIGLYRMEMWTFYIKIVLGLVMYISNAGNTIWYMIFLIVD